MRIISGKRAQGRPVTPAAGLTSAALLLMAAAQQSPAQTTDARAQEEALEEIIVTGVRASLVRGLENKRNSTQIIESIVAEDVGKLPDNNVVEALQRVTGVQVTNRGGGEASAVFIRGLPDVTTTWNGRNVFTASGRQFALADIPANLVNRIDIYKTRAAEQIETGIAGQVDVQTRRPFHFADFEFSMAARGIYQEQRDTISPNVSALVSNRWDTGAGEFGALVNVSFEQTRFRDQSVTAGALVPFATADNPPAGWGPLERFFPTYDDGRAPGQLLWQPGMDRGLSTAPGSTLTIDGQAVEYLLARDAIFASDFTGKRERPAVNVALQYAPNDSSEYVFEFFYDGFRNETFNNLHFSFADWWGSLGPDPASTFTLYPGTNLIKSRTVGFPFGFNSGDFTDQKTDSYVYALNGSWDVGDRLRLNADLSYQDSEFETSFLAMRTTRVAESISVDFNSGGGLPAFSFGDNSLLTDPAQWTVAEFFDNANSAEGDAVTLTLDGDYEADRGILKTLGFGVRYDDRGASEAQRTQDAPSLGVPLSDFDDGLQNVNSGFFDGQSDVPTTWVVANGFYLRDNADEIRSVYRNSVDPGIETSENLALVDNFDIGEKTASVYLQADFEPEIAGRPLKTQIGLRYVNVRTDMSFIDQQSLEQSSASSEVNDLLPSLTLRYDLTDDLTLRFNYGETLRRPNFIDLNPNLLLTDDLTDVGFGTASGGNPDLSPTEAKNYDLALEWYFADDSAIYATLFRREIDGLVVPFRRVVSIEDPDFDADQFVVTQPDNASDGVLEGIEFGFVYFPEDLPGLLDGLGAQGSFTALDSSQNIPITNELGEVVDEAETDFFGVSDFSYNLTLAYDTETLGMRLSYVWREDFLNNNEAALFANPIGIWRKPEKSLDFQLTYRFNNQAAITLDAVNLTDELQQSYYAFEDAGGPDTNNFGSTIISRSFALGLRYSF